MALARWQATIVDEAGNVQPAAEIEVRDEGTGLLATLFADRDGEEPLGNPFDADTEGYAGFHVVGGRYRIKATSGADEVEWRDVGIGLASETDGDEIDTADFATRPVTNGAGHRVLWGAADSGALVDGGADVPAEPLGAYSAVGTKTANYTLVLTDAGKLIEMNVASGNTLTIPPNSSVAFPVGTRIDGVQIGAGQTTITAGVGVTIRQRLARLKAAGQWAGWSLYKRGTNEWVLWGDVVA